MNHDEMAQFQALFASAAAVYGETLSGDRLRGYWSVLAPRMTVGGLRAALDAHMADPERGRFWPKPADLLATCAQDDGRPSSDAAWAIALESYDEASTVFVTPEILLARNAARPVWQIGDEVGARMAFRAVYEAALQKARGAGQPAQWKASLGHDAAQRVSAVRQAEHLGRITAEQARVFLPDPDVDTPMDPGMATVAGLLAGRVVEHPSAAGAGARRMLDVVKQAIAEAERDQAAERAERELHRKAELATQDERKAALLAEFEVRWPQRADDAG